MTNMSTGSREIARRGIARVMGSVVAAAVLLAGCSSGGGSDSAASGADLAALAGGESWDEAVYDVEDRAVGENPADADQHMIVTGQLYMTVDDPIAAAASATDIVNQAGGRIDARQETAADEYSGGSAWLTLRIPAEKLDETVKKLGELGKVDDFQTSSANVTTQVTDLEAQISTLRASTSRIEALLDQAEDIADIIALETELADRQGRLEGLEARQRGLNDQVSMSTIELSLTTEPIVEVDDDPTSFWDGLVAGWNGLLAFLSGFLVVLGVLLPWLVLLAVLVLAVVIPVRVSSKRKADRALSTPAHAAAPVTQTPPSAPTDVETPPATPSS